MPNKTLFTFSSFDYPDCHIYTDRIIGVKHIVVQAVQPSTLVTSLVTEPFGRENIIDEVKGKTEVSGTLFDVTGDVDFDDAHPFTIWIKREDVGVELIVMDCWLINNSERETNFTARAIVDWHPIGQRAGAKTIPPNQPVTISGLQVTLPYRNKGVNQNKDRFVGILESWEPQAKQYQHVDKSIPERTYIADKDLEQAEKPDTHLLDDAVDTTPDTTRDSARRPVDHLMEGSIFSYYERVVKPEQAAKARETGDTARCICPSCGSPHHYKVSTEAPEGPYMEGPKKK